MRSTDPTNQFIEVFITLTLNKEVEGQLTLSNATVSGNATLGTLIGRFLLDGSFTVIWPAAPQVAVSRGLGTDSRGRTSCS